MISHDTTGRARAASVQVCQSQVIAASTIAARDEFLNAIFRA
jgi:hypothetical protein